MSIFIKCRFTYNDTWFTPSMEFKWFEVLNDFISQYGIIEGRTYGEEESSQKHIHIHYDLKLYSDKRIPKVIHQTFIYYITSQKKLLKGKPPSKSSSITVETKETEPGRIMQYPLKQDKSHFHLCLGYTKAELNDLHSRANQEFRDCLKKKQTRQAKKDKDQQTWEKLCKYVDDNLKQWNTDKEILGIEEIVKNTTLSMYHYMVEHKGCQVSRALQDKALRYLMTRGIFNPEDVYYFYYERHKF